MEQWLGSLANYGALGTVSAVLLVIVYKVVMKGQDYLQKGQERLQKEHERIMDKCDKHQVAMTEIIISLRSLNGKNRG